MRALTCLSFDSPRRTFMAAALAALAAIAMPGQVRAQSSPAPSKCMAIANDLRSGDTAAWVALKAPETMRAVSVVHNPP